KSRCYNGNVVAVTSGVGRARSDKHTISVIQNIRVVQQRVAGTSTPFINSIDFSNEHLTIDYLKTDFRYSFPTLIIHPYFAHGTHGFYT
ncbi:hypothetical protein L9F63_024941, partial [Diploptera punctata]